MSGIRRSLLAVTVVVAVAALRRRRRPLLPTHVPGGSRWTRDAAALGAAIQEGIAAAERASAAPPGGGEPAP